MLNTLGKNFSRQHFDFFSVFPGISYKLSPLETICMKCQNLFSGKKEPWYLFHMPCLQIRSPWFLGLSNFCYACPRVKGDRRNCNYNTVPIWVYAVSSDMLVHINIGSVSYLIASVKRNIQWNLHKRPLSAAVTSLDWLQSPVTNCFYYNPVW